MPSHRARRSWFGGCSTRRRSHKAAYRQVRRRALGWLPNGDRLSDRVAELFLYGFAKNERENIGDRELDDLKKLAKLYLGYGDVQIAAALEASELTEVMCQ